MYANNVSNLDQILSSLQCYRQSSRVRGDVYQLLRQIPSLQPNCGMFAHNDGSTSTLLNLEGTIPIFYRGNQYNIPVEFWLVEAYPMAPPVCFVRPTPDMMVKPGHPHVTSEGFVKIPYTTDWRQDSTLVELVAHMCSIFGNLPPVFRRPAHLMQQQPPVQQYTQQPSPYYSQQQQQQPPPAPQQQQPLQQAYVTGVYQQPSDSDAALFGHVPAPSVVPPPRVSVEDRTNALKVDVTAKIQSELERTFHRIRDDIDLQFEHQLQLTQSRENVERGVQSLEFLRDDLLRATQMIATQDSDVTLWLDENEAKDVMDPDTILVESDVLSRQMLKTLAESNAIEDALYYLDRALSNGEIELSVFLKEVRKLSRRQFTCQALLQRVHETQAQRATPAFTSA